MLLCCVCVCAQWIWARLSLRPTWGRVCTATSRSTCTNTRWFSRRMSRLTRTWWVTGSYPPHNPTLQITSAAINQQCRNQVWMNDVMTSILSNKAISRTRLQDWLLDNLHLLPHRDMSLCWHRWPDQGFNPWPLDEKSCPAPTELLDLQLFRVEDLVTRQFLIPGWF